MNSTALAHKINIEAATFDWRESRDLGPALVTALEAAKDARGLIKEAQEVLRAQPYRDGTEIEKAARQYQIDLVKWQLTRAAEIGEERLRYFDKITSDAQIEPELQRSTAGGVQGTIHWFRFYAWGFDPRPDAPLAVQPFALFEFQERYIRWLENLVFSQRASGLVEKARDMGATIGAINWTIKHWRFSDGFSALYTSANEDLIDSKKDPDTLFEKARFQIRLLPQWMLPDGFDVERDLPYMNIANPVNGAVITGQAPTAKVGRQRRRTVVLKDESQSWPFGGFPQHRSLSQTSRSLIDIGTPEGRHNQYAQIRHCGHANVFTMDWREHPWKDQRWRDSLTFGYTGPVMSAQDIAQEIERNYDASQPGKIFPQWREEYCLITWAEVVAFYKKFELDRYFFKETGAYRVPDDWTWGRTFDYGQTPGHPWIVTWAARPRENYPLSDSVFIFFSHRITPDGAAVGEAQPQIESAEKLLGFRNDKGEFVSRYHFSECSHEAKDARKTFREEHGEYWQSWDTNYDLGIPQMQEWIMLIDVGRANPIRPQLMGRARIYFVAPNDEYRLVYNEQSGGYFVTPSKSDLGYKLLRLEMPAYHYPPEEAGKAARDMRPFKKDDDTIDTLRGFATHWGPGIAPLTESEKQEKKLPAGLQRKNLNQREPGFQRDIGEFVRDVKISDQKREQKQHGENWTSDVMDPKDAADEFWNTIDKDQKW